MFIKIQDYFINLHNVLYFSYLEDNLSICVHFNEGQQDIFLYFDSKSSFEETLSDLFDI